MKIIQQTEIVDKVNENLEIAQKYIGKAMGCIAELDDVGGMYGERNYYGNRIGYRGDEWEDMPIVNRYGERRMRDRYGRFI